MHARPVMRFVDVASTFSASVNVTNLSGRNERVDGKSAMEMMLLEAVQGSVLRIEANGDDAKPAIEALSSLVESGFSDGLSANTGDP
jgi:phosphotransferase system HPr (HPr) family protein